MKQSSIRRRGFLLSIAAGAVMLTAAGCNNAQQVETLESQNQALATRIIELENQLQQAEAAMAATPAPTPAPAAGTQAAGGPFPTRGEAAPIGQTEYRTYTVAEGDNLWNIARRQLGRGIRYREILELNPSISADEPLAIGTKLVLPPQ